MSKMKLENHKKKFKKDNYTRKNSNIRAQWINIIIWGAFFGLVTRLTYVMVYKSDEYSSMAKVQWDSQMKVRAKRGDIVDRNGNILATSIESYRVDLDLVAIQSYSEQKKISMDKIASELSFASGVNVEEVKQKLKTVDENGQNVKFSVLVKGVEKKVADEIRNLKIYGTVISSNSERYYPNKSFLAHALGSVNSDNQGLNGVELKYDDLLTGIDGMRITERDATFKELPYKEAEFTKPVDGKNLTLTIDENIQDIAEKVAEKGLKDNDAKEVSVVVMNPNNGDVLAMVNTPDFDPNHPYEEYEKFPGDNNTEKFNNMFRNSFVSDTYEPGSTFKTVTISAALEEGLVNGNDTFYCGGKKMFGSTPVKCWKQDGHGTQNLSQILQNSCNVGFMDLGAKIGKEKMMEYTKRLGFGKLTGIDLPGEEVGILKDVDKITDLDLATIAFGQTNTVTGVQLLTAFNAIANGGTLVQPHLLKDVSHKFDNGTKVIDETFVPAVKENVLSKETTATVRKYLEQAINQGGPEGSFIKGYRIGGKTGTAQVPDFKQGGYAKGKYISSVVALYPVENPQITVFIAVKQPNPDKYYAGEVAVPLLKELSQQVCAYMGSEVYKERYTPKPKVVIPELRGKTIEEARKILSENKLNITIDDSKSKVESMIPYPGYTVDEGAIITINSKKAKPENNNKIMMPNLKGMTLGEATKILDSLDLEYDVSGSGKIVKQNVIEGQLIEAGVKIKLDLR